MHRPVDTIQGLRSHLRNYGISELIMQKLPLLVLFIVFSVGLCCSQSLSDPLSQGTSSQGTSVDCSDPREANSPLCGSAQQQRSPSIQGMGGSSLPISTPALTTPYGFSPDQYTPTIPTSLSLTPQVQPVLPLQARVSQISIPSSGVA